MGGVPAITKNLKPLLLEMGLSEDVAIEAVALVTAELIKQIGHQPITDSRLAWVGIPSSNSCGGTCDPANWGRAINSWWPAV